jgi:deazaflavin-dependent oxidoreductase (nitroreductase family)
MCSPIDAVADQKILCLTTVGGRTGLPRPIEIWFVADRGRLYLFAEKGVAASWVKNIRRNPAVQLRVGDWDTCATARVLDAAADRALWDHVAAMADRKYGWGAGLAVELTPCAAESDAAEKMSAAGRQP